MGKEYVVKTGENTYYINNNPGAYLTLRFDSGEFEQTQQPGVYRYNGRFIQLISMNYDTRRYFVKGKPLAEDDLLHNFMENEISYIRKGIRGNLNAEEEMFFNHYRKQFLVWSYQAQDEKDLKEQEELKKLSHLGIVANEEVDSILHQVNLTFVANNKLFSIVYPVFIHDDLEAETEVVKALADDVMVYGFPVDIKALAEKEHAFQNNYHFQVSDPEADIVLYIPDWMNVCQYPGNKTLLATMPEVQNFMSVLNVQWELKDEKKDFKYFINSHLSDSTITKYYEVTDHELENAKYFEVLKNGYFRCVYVFIEGKKANCWTSFIASPSSYRLDMPKFNEFIHGVDLN